MTTRYRQPPRRSVAGVRVRFSQHHDDEIKRRAIESGISFRRAAEQIIRQRLVLEGF